MNMNQFIEDLKKNYEVKAKDSGKVVLVNKDGLNKRAVILNGKLGKKRIKQFGLTQGLRFTQNEVSEIVENLEAEVDEIDTQNTFLRVYRKNQHLEIDLCDVDGNVVRVDDKGFEVTKDASSVVFETNALMKALPFPDPEGDVQLLTPYINLPETETLLVIGWLTYTLSHPKVTTTNFLILLILGDQGSGKSLLTKILTSLVDPSDVGTQIFPRKQSDLIAFASQRHLIAYDNMRVLTDLISDLLCVCCTGGSASVRKLYTDGDIHDAYVHIAMIINGIHNPITQSDLAQRTLSVEMLPVEATDRKSEAELMEQFESEKGLIFGGILNLITKILANLPTVEVTHPQRMIEFSRWLAAMEIALELETSTLQEAFSDSVNEAQFDSVLDDVLATEVVEFAKSLSNNWEGTPAKLLQKLDSRASDRIIRSNAWPKSPISLSKRLKSQKAALINAGVEIVFKRGKERLIVISNLEAF